MNRKAEKVLQSAAHVVAVYDTLSFTRAAERLNLHQSAVSHRIKQLEAQLGYDLFERTTRRLEPTGAGRDLAGALDQALALISGSIDKIDAGRRGGAIRLSVPSSLAMKWLIPNLESARQAGVDVSLHAQDDVVDLAAGEADAAIRFGRLPAGGLHALKLCNVWLRPVASPAYLRGIGDPWSGQFIGDRRGEADDTGFSWQAWSTAAGMSPPPQRQGYLFRPGRSHAAGGDFRSGCRPGPCADRRGGCRRRLPPICRRRDPTRYRLLARRHQRGRTDPGVPESVAMAEATSGTDDAVRSGRSVPHAPGIVIVGFAPLRALFGSQGRVNCWNRADSAS